MVLPANLPVAGIPPPHQARQAPARHAVARLAWPVTILGENLSYSPTYVHIRTSYTPEQPQSRFCPARRLPALLVYYPVAIIHGTSQILSPSCRTQPGPVFQILLMDAVETGLLVTSFVALVASKSFSTSEEASVRYDVMQVSKSAKRKSAAGTKTSRGPARGHVVRASQAAVASFSRRGTQHGGRRKNARGSETQRAIGKARHQGIARLHVVRGRTHRQKPRAALPPSAGPMPFFFSFPLTIPLRSSVLLTPDCHHHRFLRDGWGQGGGARLAQLRPAADVGVQCAGHLRELGDPLDRHDVSVKPFFLSFGIVFFSSGFVFLFAWSWFAPGVQTDHWLLRTCGHRREKNTHHTTPTRFRMDSREGCQVPDRPRTDRSHTQRSRFSNEPANRALSLCYRSF